MYKNNRLQDLTLASIMLAIFLLIHFVFSANNRGIQSAIGAITPIPAVIYAYCSRSTHYIAFIISGVLLALILYEPLLLISFIIPNLIFGVIIGFLLKKQYKYILVLITAISIFFNLYELFINYIITGISFIKLNMDAIDVSIRIMQGQYKNFNSKIYYDINLFAIPIVMTMGGFVKGYLILLISKLLLNRIMHKKIQIPYQRNLSIMKMSKVLLTLYGLTMIVWLGIIGNYLNYNSIHSLLLDITMAYMCMYSVFYVIVKNDGSLNNKIGNRIKLILQLFVCLLICPILAVKEVICNGAKNKSS